MPPEGAAPLKLRVTVSQAQRPRPHRAARTYWVRSWPHSAHKPFMTTGWLHPSSRTRTDLETERTVPGEEGSPRARRARGLGPALPGTPT